MSNGMVNLIGSIWWPYGAICAMDYSMSAEDVAEVLSESDGTTFREAVEDWLGTRTGDFSSIVDFRADLPGCEVPWLSEESEGVYDNCMYGEEE